MCNISDCFCSIVLLILVFVLLAIATYANFDPELLFNQVKALIAKLLQ